MATITFEESLRPEALTPAQRARHTEELQDLVCRIFDGPSAAAFARCLFDGSAGKIFLHRYLDADRRLVGFNACLLAEIDVDGVPTSVFRGFAGMLPEYRGGQNIMAAWLKVVLPYMLRNAHRRIYFFTPVAHVSSYRVLAKHVPTMYPHPDTEMTDDILALFRRLAAQFRCASVDGEHPLVCNRGTWVRDPRLPAHAPPDDALSRFYARLNPRFAEGNCLLALVPVTPQNVAAAALRYGQTRARRWWSGARAAVRPAQQPVAAQVLAD